MDKRYPSNSKFKKKEKEERIVKPVVNSEDVKIRKKGLFSKMIGSFFAKDLNSMSEYLIGNVIVPKVQDIFIDTVNQATEYMVYGDTRASRLNNKKSTIYFSGVNGNKKTSIGAVSDKYPSNRMSSIDRKKSYDDYSDLIFKERQIAEEILSRMYDDLSEYGCVTVLSLKSMIGVETTHTDEKYGWMELAGSRIKKVRDGWLLELPTAIFLD